MFVPPTYNLLSTPPTPLLFVRIYLFILFFLLIIHSSLHHIIITEFYPPSPPTLRQNLLRVYFLNVLQLMVSIFEDNLASVWLATNNIATINKIIAL